MVELFILDDSVELKLCWVSLFFYYIISPVGNLSSGGRLFNIRLYDM